MTRARVEVENPEGFLSSDSDRNGNEKRPVGGTMDVQLLRTLSG